MKPLFELTDNYLRLLEAIADPEFSWDDVADTAEMIQDEFDEKAEGYGKVIAQLQAEAAGLKAEEQRLAERRRRAEEGAERLKAKLLDAMLTTGQNKVKTPLFTFSTRKSASVVVDDLESVPFEMLKFKDPEPDKTAIKKYLAENPDCAWAHMDEKQNLQIK